MSAYIIQGIAKRRLQISQSTPTLNVYHDTPCRGVEHDKHERLLAA